MKILGNVLMGIGGLSMLGINLAFVAMHLWTILVAFEVGGFGAAFVTLLAPIFAQVFWFFWFWWHAGFMNGYTVIVLALLVFVAVAGAFAWAGASIVERATRE